MSDSPRCDAEIKSRSTGMWTTCKRRAVVRVWTRGSVVDVCYCARHASRVHDPVYTSQHLKTVAYIYQ